MIMMIMMMMTYSELWDKSQHLCDCIFTLVSQHNDAGAGDDADGQDHNHYHDADGRDHNLYHDADVGDDQ